MQSIIRARYVISKAPSCIGRSFTRSASASSVASTSTLPSSVSSHSSTVASSPTASDRVAPPKLLSYNVHRTKSEQLPVYAEIKSGGQRVFTIVRKIDGNLEALRKDLEEAMPGVASHIKPQARQIIMRGDVVKDTKEWLGDRGF